MRTQDYQNIHRSAHSPCGFWLDGATDLLVAENVGIFGFWKVLLSWADTWHGKNSLPSEGGFPASLLSYDNRCTHTLPQRRFINCSFGVSLLQMCTMLCLSGFPGCLICSMTGA